MRFPACIAALLLATRISALNLRTSDSGLSVFGDEPDVDKYKYIASNQNTRPPKSFSDDVVPDMAYHEAPPAVRVLQQLAETTPQPTLR
jgi:hypothetical protein